MAEVLNLRQARKARERAARKAEADANAAKHGANKGARAAARAEADKLVRTLDGARREGEGRDGDDR
jgi:hypothetical protein